MQEFRLVCLTSFIRVEWIPAYSVGGTLTVYGDQLDAFNQAVGGTIKFMPWGGMDVNRPPDVEAIFEFISIQEGARVVGHATITKIFNPLLCLKDKD